MPFRGWFKKYLRSFRGSEDVPNLAVAGNGKHSLPDWERRDLAVEIRTRRWARLVAFRSLQLRLPVGAAAMTRLKVVTFGARSARNFSSRSSTSARAVLVWMQVVQSPDFFATGSQSCCGIQRTLCCVKVRRANPSDRTLRPSSARAQRVLPSNPWRGATNKRG